MEDHKSIEVGRLSPAFIAGVASVVCGNGMHEKDAEALVDGICKQAAGGYPYYIDDDAFWSRNKNWLIPLLVGSGAFWLGANSQDMSLPTYRADSGYVMNALRNVGGRLSTLFGLNETPIERMLIDKKTLESNKPKDTELADALERIGKRLKLG